MSTPTTSPHSLRGHDHHGLNPCRSRVTPPLHHHHRWARNPIPRQGEYSAGATKPNATSKAGWVSFPPPCPWDCSGQPECQHPGTVNRYHDTQQNLEGCSGDWRGGQVVDTLVIPADLEPGQWVLGFRWDCE